jgi:hypothetical protein
MRAVIRELLPLSNTILLSLMSRQPHPHHIITVRQHIRRIIAPHRIARVITPAPTRTHRVPVEIAEALPAAGVEAVAVRATVEAVG